MLTVTKSAADLLKAAQLAAGATEDAGIRIRTAAMSEHVGKPAFGFSIADEPDPMMRNSNRRGCASLWKMRLSSISTVAYWTLGDDDEGLQLVLG
jgi:hypothetical protein